MMRSVALRLTLFYLAIIMALSIGFSIFIYRISTREITRNFSGPTATSGTVGGGNVFQFVNPDRFDDFVSLREQQQQASERRLRNNLVLLNLGTLVVGALMSYSLARRTLEPIEEAFEAQGRFTSDASHELRTPLTAMQTSIEVGLRNPKLTLKESKSLLEGTLDEVKKLTALSNGLLKLTRSNGRDLPMKPVSIKKVAGDAVDQLELAAANKEITLNNKTSAIEVLGDEVSIKEAVVILLDNAIKYSESKKSIELASRVQGKFAHISVTDHGPGMKATDMQYIFDRFYRADQSRSREHIEGYGLGLPIAKQIADAHGGSIEVKSRPGEGSVFTLKLPLSSSKLPTNS